eukprot:scaffold16156_cov68-Phaeocystis_antarctica.AAC.2
MKVSSQNYQPTKGIECCYCCCCCCRTPLAPQRGVRAVGTFLRPQSPPDTQPVGSLRAHPCPRSPRLLSPRCSLNSSTTFTRKKIKDWMPAAMRMITCMELSSVPERALPLATMAYSTICVPSSSKRLTKLMRRPRLRNSSSSLQKSTIPKNQDTVLSKQRMKIKVGRIKGEAERDPIQGPVEELDEEHPHCPRFGQFPRWSADAQ